MTVDLGRILARAVEKAKAPGAVAVVGCGAAVGVAARSCPAPAQAVIPSAKNRVMTGLPHLLIFIALYYSQITVGCSSKYQLVERSAFYENKNPEIIDFSIKRNMI